MIGLRLNRGGRTAGLTGQGLRIIHNNDQVNLIAFQRWRDHGVNDDVVVIANLSAAPLSNYRIGFPSAGSWQLMLDSDFALYSPQFNGSDSRDIAASDDDFDGMSASADITVGPYSILIYSWQG